MELIVMEGTVACTTLRDARISGATLSGEHLRSLDKYLAVGVHDDEVFTVFTERKREDGSVAFTLTGIGRLAGGTDAASASLPPKIYTGEVLSVDDTLSDAAYLDECAMRIIAADMSRLSATDSGGAFARGAYFGGAGLAYDIAEIMLAERKRRRGESAAVRMEPTQWFRMRSPDGRLWMESSDENEARSEARKTGYPLERMYAASLATEWRREGGA